MQVTRYRKVWGVFLACTMLGFFATTATPGSAHVPPDNNTNFNPDEFNGDGDPAVFQVKEAEILSDNEDGFGTQYEFRAVADSQTAFYEWYDCDDGANPTVAGPACQLAATDTTPDFAPAPAGEGTAASFSAQYDIPQSSNAGNPRDIYGFACQSDATTGGPADTGDCIANDVTPGALDGNGCGFGGASGCVDQVHVDNAQTTGDHPATTNGRIHMLVTPSATFTHPNVHGAGLKNSEAVTFVAFTSGGGTVDAVQICLDQFSDDEQPNDNAPDGDGAGCDVNGTDLLPTSGGGSGCHASAPTAAGGDCWAVTLTPVANTVYGASLIEIDDIAITGGGDGEGSTWGTGDCAGSMGTGNTTDGDDCQLDKIYITTTPTGEAAAPGPGPGPGPPPIAQCNKIRGTRGDDKLRGTRGCDIIRGRGGDDVMRGRGGDDRLRGGGGFDKAFGGPGNDRCTAERKRSC